MADAFPSIATLPDRLALIIDGLRRALAVRAGVNAAVAPIVLLLWNRLSRIVQRFAAIAARVGAGKPPIRRRPSAAPVSPRQSPPPSLRPHGTPRGFGWLLRLLGPAPNVAGAGWHLTLLLAEPEMVALLAVAPQVARVLRPLCRMLAVPFPPASPRRRRIAPALSDTAALPEMPDPAVASTRAVAHPPAPPDPPQPATRSVRLPARRAHLSPRRIFCPG